MTKTYTSINASAGSGKTYILVQRILMLCLRYPKQQESIKHILALTFTNKAANEMKARILTWLISFSQPDFDKNQELIGIQKALGEDKLHIDLEELHLRSKKVLDYILHHYSTLNIGTIDKFNAKLVRSFSYELNLAQNFNLEIDPEPHLLEAVDKMLAEIGENKIVSDAFMDYIHYSLDNDEKVNLNKTLYQSAKAFVNDIHYEELKNNDQFDWHAYENIKNKLRIEIKALKKNSIDLAKPISSLLKEKNLEIEDFSGGKTNGIAKFFFEFLKFISNERPKFPFPANENAAQTIFANITSTSAKHKQQEIKEILDFLVQTRQTIIQNHIEIKKKEKILGALLPLRVNNEIQEKLKEIEDENDLVLLSKFNVIINENLKNEPSSFIYEKIGTQFQHYFFDEFQDTSKMQWDNFLPLRDHTISSENNTFTLVGDPKQSIYRFRGGDSQIMLNINNGEEKTPVPVDVQVLKSNYRSAKNIVKFNNELYPYLSNLLKGDHQKIFGEDAVQIAESGKEGRVKVHLIEKSVKNALLEEFAEKMQQDIQECLDHGYSFSDITILCRGNSEIYHYSRLLGNKKVNYHGENVYIKTISDKGLTLDLSTTLLAIMEYLRWQTQPEDQQFLVKMMYYLQVSGRIKMDDFSSEMMTILSYKSLNEIDRFLWEKYHLKLVKEGIPALNIYKNIEYYVQEFSVPEKELDYLLNFLEMLYNYSQNNASTIKDFINYWEEEGAKTAIQTSDNLDAIEIMTIHKSKGLEFPIVLLPMENSNIDEKIENWFALEDEEILKTVHIKKFDTVLLPYSAEMMNFNEENTYKNKLDRFCLQYVATTRAVEQLFFYLEKNTINAKGEESASKIEILDFIHEKNIKNEDSFDIYPVSEDAKTKKKDQKTKVQNTLSITTLEKNIDNTSSIKIATPSKNYQNQVEKVRIGIFTHEILSKINSKKEIADVLSQYELDGVITNTESQEISLLLNEIIDKNTDYFSENLEIINEKDIMITEDGKTSLYRPDRLIKTENGYKIIDFKTGKPLEKHQKQVDLYEAVLEKIGKKVIEKKLIYI